MSKDRDDLIAALKRIAGRKMTPEEMAVQRRDYVISEMGWGSDKDEAAYSAALASGDKEALRQLEVEAEERMARAEKLYDKLFGGAS